MHHPTDRIIHTTAFVTPVVGHWLVREIGAIIKALIKIKDSVASKYIRFTDSFLCLHMKPALDLPCVKVGVPYIDFKHHIS